MTSVTLGKLAGGMGPDQLPDATLRSLRRLLLVAAALIVLAAIPFLSGLVGALVLFALTRRLHAKLARVITARGSAVTIAIGALAVVVVPGTWLVATIVSEARSALAAWRPDDLDRWLSTTRFGSFDVAKEAASAATSLLGWLSSHVVQLLGSVTNVVLNAFLAFVGLYYLLLQAPALWRHVIRLLAVPEHIADLLVVRFAAVTDALILGTMLTALLQGTIVGAAFALVDLRPAILWGFVTACASVFPLLGSSFVWGPGVVVLLARHSFGAAALLAVLGGGLASNIDNLTRPMVYRRVSGIHPMLTLVGAFAGVRLLGVVGAFIGPLVLSCFGELLALYEEAVTGDATLGLPPRPRERAPSHPEAMTDAP